MPVTLKFETPEDLQLWNLSRIKAL